MMPDYPIDVTTEVNVILADDEEDDEESSEDVGEDGDD